MRNALLFIVNSINKHIPQSRFFSIKRSLYRIGGLRIGKNVRLMQVKLSGSRINIGDDTFIGDETIIAGDKFSTVSIGNSCDISTRVLILTGSHEIDMLGSHSAGTGYGKDIVIEDGVWIGAGAIILPGVRIGKKAVVGAGSLVTKDVQAYSVVAGVPATTIKIWNSTTLCWK